MNEDKNIDNFIEKGYWYNEIFQQGEKKWLTIEQANELDNIRNNRLKLQQINEKCTEIYNELNDKIINSDLKNIENILDEINIFNKNQKCENEHVYIQLYKTYNKRFKILQSDNYNIILTSMNEDKNINNFNEKGHWYNEIFQQGEKKWLTIEQANELDNIRNNRLQQINEKCTEIYNELNDKIINSDLENIENILDEINIFNENQKCENEHVYIQLYETYNKRFEILQLDNYNIILTSMNEDKNIDNFIKKGHWYNEIFQQEEKKWITIEQANKLDNIRNNRLQQINEKCTEIYNELNDKIINSDLENIENILDEINIFNKNQKCENEHVHIQLYETYNQRFKILQSDNYNIILTSMNEDKNIDNFIEKGYWYNEIFQQEEKK